MTCPPQVLSIPPPKSFRSIPTRPCLDHTAAAQQPPHLHSYPLQSISPQCPQQPFTKAALNHITALLRTLQGSPSPQHKGPSWPHHHQNHHHLRPTPAPRLPLHLPQPSPPPSLYLCQDGPSIPPTHLALSCLRTSHMLSFPPGRLFPPSSSSLIFNVPSQGKSAPILRPPRSSHPSRFPITHDIVTFQEPSPLQACKCSSLAAQQCPLPAPVTPSL